MLLFVTFDRIAATINYYRRCLRRHKVVHTMNEGDFAFVPTETQGNTDCLF